MQQKTTPHNHPKTRPNRHKNKPTRTLQHNLTITITINQSEIFIKNTPKTSEKNHANVWKYQINPVTLHSLSKGNATEKVQNESNLDDILDIVQQERKTRGQF